MAPPRKVCGCCGELVAPGTHGLLGPDGRQSGSGRDNRPSADPVDWAGLRDDILLVLIAAATVVALLRLIAAPGFDKPP